MTKRNNEQRMEGQTKYLITILKGIQVKIMGSVWLVVTIIYFCGDEDKRLYFPQTNCYKKVSAPKNYFTIIL